MAVTTFNPLQAAIHVNLGDDDGRENSSSCGCSGGLSRDTELLGNSDVSEDPDGEAARGESQGRLGAGEDMVFVEEGDFRFGTDKPMIPVVSLPSSR